MRVVSAVYDCAPSLSPALRSLHGRPGCSGSNRSTDLLPPLPLSLSPFISADDEAYALIHGDASSTSSSTSLRLKPAARQTAKQRNLQGSLRMFPFIISRSMYQNLAFYMFDVNEGILSKSNDFSQLILPERKKPFSLWIYYTSLMPIWKEV